MNNPSNIQSKTCAVQTNQIKINNFLAADSGPETFTVTVTGRTNPSKTPASGFSIATVSSAGFILEQIKGLTIVITGNMLTAFSLSADSTITSNANTLYTFTIGHNAPLSNGYKIQISFPSDFLFLNYSSIVCTVAGAPVPCGRLNSTFATNTHTVLFSINHTIPTVGTVTISSVTNPQEQKTTGAFSASILDAQGVVVESSNQAPTITMTGTGSFSSFVATTYNLSSASTTR